MTLNVELLEQSFAKVKPQAAQFAEVFYHNLFVDYPQAQPLFANTNMNEQKKHLVAALALVVDNLRQPNALTDAVKKLGARHVDYGTMAEHYPLVGATLLKTFAITLGTGWTEPVHQAWVEAYEAITAIMLEGATELTV
jgi:hemoglobin-like flavoprotein